MKSDNKYRVILLNLLIAVAISLVVNFYILIFKLMPAPSPFGGMRAVAQSNIYHLLQFFFFFVLAFALLSIATSKLGTSKTSSGLIKRIVLCVLVTAGMYLIAPRYSREGEVITMLSSSRWIEPMLILKCSFTLIVAVLYGRIYELIYQKQRIVLENEVLKNENLQTTYNTLISQINPHFFFNSLNSLSMLVRQERNDQALAYIDRLCDTFRYIIQNGQDGGDTTLEEELRFMEAYNHLLEVRYEGKLHFDIEIEEQYYRWRLPAFTIQPLIENVVKHNTITKARPMTISIRVDDRKLVISNKIAPKIEEVKRTETGLKNLSQRYLLLTGKDIIVERKEDVFSVSLPLAPPKKTEQQ